MARRAVSTLFSNRQAEQLAAPARWRRRAEHPWLLFCLVLLAASCSPSPSSEVSVAMTGDFAVKDAVADVIRARLGAVVEGRAEVFVTVDGLRLELPIDTSEEVLGLILARGEISMRPVLGIPSEGQAIPLDAGILMVDQSGIGYRVGPPFLTPDDFVDGHVEALGSQQPDVFLVDPKLTPSGADAFVAATQALAEYPNADPRRQIVIAVDGIVLTAPSIAADVDPDEGLPADSIVFTIESGIQASARDRAEAITSYLRFGSLPVDLERVE